MYHAMLNVDDPRGHVLAARVRQRRLGDAGRGHEELREGVRLHHPRGLRAERDLAGRVVQPPRQGAQGGLDRHADRGRGDEARRRGRQGRRPGRGGRDRDPRPQRDEGLLAARGRDRGGHAQWLVPLRRHGHAGRGRLLLHRRPQEGHDHPRRLQRLPARDRGGALRAPGRVRGGRDRRARRRRSARRSPRWSSSRGARPPRTSCAPSSRSASRPTSTRARSGSPTGCPKGPTGKILKREIKAPDA